MFNKKPLIIWGAVIAVLSSIYGVYKAVNLETQDPAKQAFEDFVRLQKGEDKEAMNLAKAKKGEANLQKIKAEIPLAKDRLEAVFSKYELGCYVRITDKPKRRSENAFSRWGKDEPDYYEFDENKMIDFSLSQYEDNKAFLRLVVKLHQKEYLAIKGGWKAVAFMRKFSKDAKTSSHGDFNFTYSERLQTGWTSTDQDGQIINRRSFCFNNTDRYEKKSLEEGLYLIQYHLYPSRLMSENVQGIMKSPVYYLRVRS